MMMTKKKLFFRVFSSTESGSVITSFLIKLRWMAAAVKNTAMEVSIMNLIILAMKPSILIY